MQRNILALALGASMIGALALAACSGGGGNATSLPATTTSTNNNSSTTSTTTGAHITLTVSRTKATKTKHAWLQSAHRRTGATASTRKPAYIGYGAEGLQVTVTGGGSSKSVYADISEGSSLCTPASGAVATCTIAIPTIATTESVTATEVDETPTNESNGYGTGFPTNSNVLAVGTGTANITGGNVAVTVGLAPVWSGTIPDDCFGVAGGYYEENTTAGIDTSTNRLTMTAGLAETDSFYVCVEDADDNSGYNLPSPSPMPSGTPLPFVDVNGSPAPITLVSTTTHLQVAALPYPTPASVTFAQSASIGNSSFLAYNDCVAFALQTDGNIPSPLTSPQTLTFSTNISAPNPFSGATPAPASQTVTLTLVPISASPTSATISVSGTGSPMTATVQGSDYGASQSMQAYNFYNSGGTVYPNAQGCIDTSNSSQTDAAVAAANTLSATNSPAWSQNFTITAQMPGTCTFNLMDGDTATPSQLITVTVNP